MTDKPLDLTKPVQTRDGRKVRILCTDGPHEQPICGIIEGKDGGDYWSWPLSGKSDAFSETRNLVNIEPEPVTLWVNVWKNMEGGYVSGRLYSSEHEARKDCDGHPTYIGAFPLTFTPKE